MPVARTIAANPFYHPPNQWQLRVAVLRGQTDAVEDAFADIALSMSSFEANDEGTKWHTDILSATPPDEMGIPARLALLSGMLGITTPEYHVQKVEMRDWISEVERGFPPLDIGQFYVHGSHVKEKPPQSKIALQVNAGAAFGSGEHATTSGCLLALTQLAKKRTFQKPLDMGCGSGILALAMAKLWRVPVFGTDIDPISVSTARENAMINNVTSYTSFEAGDGYNVGLVRRNSRFDIITANILARPLCKMAPALASVLAPGGVAVLSGLLASQERYVLAAHRAQGLSLLMRIERKGWNTLVLRGRARS